MPPENRRRRRPRRQEPDTSGWSSEERAKHEMARKLATPLAELGVPVRAVNTLEEHDVITVGQAARLTYQELTGFKNFGQTTLTEVREIIEKFGVKLPSWDKPPRQPIVRRYVDLFE